MRRLIPVMFHDCARPALPFIFATDAEGANLWDAGGFGIVALKVPMDWVERTIEVGTKPGFTVSKLNGDFADLECPGKELAARFPVSRIPKEILQTHESSWFEIGKGRWLWRDHITLGEARATVELLQALAACPSCHWKNGSEYASIQRKRCNFSS